MDPSLQTFIATVQFVCTFSSPFLLAYIAYISTRKNQLEAQMNDKKRQMYEGFIEMLIQATSSPGGIDQTVLTQKMYAFKQNFILFGSVKTIIAFNTWLRHQNNGNTAVLFQDVERLLRAIREDIGLSNVGLKTYDLLQVLIKEDLKTYKPS